MNQVEKGELGDSDYYTKINQGQIGRIKEIFGDSAAGRNSKEMIRICCVCNEAINKDGSTRPLTKEERGEIDASEIDQTDTLCAKHDPLKNKINADGVVIPPATPRDDWGKEEWN